MIYSVGARLGGGGIGDAGHNAARGIYRQGYLHRLLVSSVKRTDIPPRLIRSMGFMGRVLRRLAIYDPTLRVDALGNALYDLWARTRLVSCDVFHGWNLHSLHTLRRARQQGSLTLVERANAHPVVQVRLLTEESERWGVPIRPWPHHVRRNLAEFQEVDYVTIPSEFVRQTFREQGYPAEKLIVNPYGVDVDRFVPGSERKGETFRVIFVGQDGFRKGVPDLLEAWRLLGWKDAELLLVGSVWPQMRPIMARYQDLPGVRQVGFVWDLLALYQSADAFALPTIEEGSALVNYEAMACGIPLVTTAHAGSVARDGIEGIIVPIRSPEEVAGALERLRTDERLRGEMGRAARRRAETFTWQAHGERLVAAYEEVLAAR